ncbi:MAG: hypothetical protein ACYC21_02860 [Eubacteriales bacterium]
MTLVNSLATAHPPAATCAGLGWVGKNGLLVTKEYGARLGWATVL